MKKTTFYLVLAAVIVAMASACSKKAEAPASLSVKEFMAQADALVGQSVTLEAQCSHLCKHGGKKMFIKDADEDMLLRVEAAELGAFPQETIGNAVKVTGTVCELRIDEEYLRAWEDQVAAQEAELLAQQQEAEAKGEMTEGEEETKSEGAEHCDTDKKARQETGNTPAERIADYRARIANQVAEGGKPYVSIYHLEALDYSIK